MKTKVQEMINKLNGSTGNMWIAIEGVHSLTSVTKNEVDSIIFNPSKGLLIKVFFNQNTNEIRLYPALMFEDAF
jgi:hypothetical protein